MITVQKANLKHVEGISEVCTNGYKATYEDSHSNEYIERIIKEFYNHDRIRMEITSPDESWDGWFVAVENNKVLGAIGGGMISKNKGEIFVLYLDPNRRGEGIGTLLLNALTQVQKQNGVCEQWVSVAKGNQKGIPFYVARGFVFQHEQEGYSNKGEEKYISNKYYRKV
ncbi:GNAT family N-acetyltransferase [Bacillus wiedmannii]|uniref:GNAT family N-acetyltransferase n=1 Tax=Bacillus wiedmannii TaxID=1890302 RepID=UPI00086429A9|nr:GNAT family N-acetyltransferase [Bacillus wiedmannii]SCN01742.1 Uncharacterized protein BCINRASA_01018 [Bacillus wiedmannii]